jgi:hypothetical protein
VNFVSIWDIHHAILAPMDQDTPQPKRRRISTLQERLDRAKLVESKAAARMRRKTQDVQKYEAQARRREQKLDTRRKIIAGAIALEHIRYDADYGVAFYKLLDEYVTKEAERVLFGLPVLPTDASSKGE